jgi:hypothetical protein
MKPKKQTNKQTQFNYFGGLRHILSFFVSDYNFNELTRHFRMILEYLNVEENNI